MYHGVTQEDRDDAPPSANSGEEKGDKKERVLHTRVPAVLEKELKRFADNLRIPVSNLVRTILEDALQVADAASEGVESRLKRAAHQLEIERERLRARVKLQPLKDVFAYQTVTLAQDVSCAACGNDLQAGDRAHMGLSDEPTNGKRRPRVFVCDACLPNKGEQP